MSATTTFLILTHCTWKIYLALKQGIGIVAEAEDLCSKKTVPSDTFHMIICRVVEKCSVVTCKLLLKRLLKDEYCGA